jgi:hypothetical protein
MKRNKLHKHLQSFEPQPRWALLQFAKEPCDWFPPYTAITKCLLLDMRPRYITNITAHNSGTKTSRYLLSVSRKEARCSTTNHAGNPQFTPAERHKRRSQWRRRLMRGSAAASWDCGFESRHWHVCVSCEVVCCQVQITASSWSLVQRSPAKCGVSGCEHEASTMRTPWPTGSCRDVKRRSIPSILNNLLPHRF